MWWERQSGSGLKDNSVVTLLFLSDDMLVRDLYLSCEKLGKLLRTATVQQKNTLNSHW